MRRTRSINRKQAENFLAGSRFAYETGRPLDQFITLNFFHTTCPADQVSVAFEKLRDNYFTPWLRRHPRPLISELEPPTYVWSVENVAGHTHVHWWLYLPERLVSSFSLKLPNWLKAVGAEVTAEEAIKVERAYNPRGLSKYLMKGLNPRSAKRYHIRPTAQGEVFGKRCGVSKSLGPAARTKHWERAAAPHHMPQKVA